MATPEPTAVTRPSWPKSLRRPASRRLRTIVAIGLGALLGGIALARLDFFAGGDPLAFP